MESTASSDSEVSIEHNDTFYFDDDPMAVFLVENQLFKVHRYYFIQGSVFFRDLFAQAGVRGDASATEGKSDKQPIPLPDVTVKEFRTLLRFFYAMSQNIDDTITGADLLKLGINEKLDLLSISHRFMFDNIIKYMVRIIQPERVDVCDRIHLGDKYDLWEWRLSAYEYLIERTSERLTKNQQKCLGPDRVVQLLEARIFLSQDRLKNALCSRCSSVTRYTISSITSARDIAVKYFKTPAQIPEPQIPIYVGSGSR